MATEYDRRKGYIIEMYPDGDSDNYLRLQIRDPRTNKIICKEFYEYQLDKILARLPDISGEKQKPKKQTQSQYL